MNRRQPTTGVLWGTGRGFLTEDLVKKSLTLIFPETLDMGYLPGMQKPLSAPPEATQEEIDQASREFSGADIDNWHFSMMNDHVRNDAYEQALAKAIKAGGKNVLDIGSGSGLLSMMAIRQGASQVVTCEAVPRIAAKAHEIIQLNGLDQNIKVINKKSTELVVGQDFAERADILVTEIFDYALLGEKALIAIEHAKKYLIKENAQIIPAGARVMAMAIESREIYEDARVDSASGFDLSPFNEFTVNGYIGYHLDRQKYRALSQPKPVFDFDFRKTTENRSIPFELEAIEDGTCHGIAFWYELKLDDEISISTGPGLSQLSCWKQAVQLLAKPTAMNAGKKLEVMAHHAQEEIWFTS